MLTIHEIEKLERNHYAAICSCSETGGLSLAEAADASARLTSRLLHECKQLLEQRAPARHREVSASQARQQMRQQVLPFAAPAAAPVS